MTAYDITPLCVVLRRTAPPTIYRCLRIYFQALPLFDVYESILKALTQHKSATQTRLISVPSHIRSNKVKQIFRQTSGNATMANDIGFLSGRSGEKDEEQWRNQDFFNRHSIAGFNEKPVRRC